MHIFPELHTQRLHLRKLGIDDVPALVKYANNKKISDWIINIPYPYEEPNAVFRISYVVQGFKQKSRFVFAIILKSEQELIGEISLHLGQDQQLAEIGYWVGEPFWGQGIASEAIEAVLRFGFDRLQLGLIFATCHIDNEASWKVLIKQGMSERHNNGKIVRYELSKHQYEEAQSTSA